MQITLESLADVENFDALAEEHWADFHNKKPVFNKDILSRCSVVVARDAGTPVGYILFMVVDSPFYDERWCHIGMYYLQRSCRSAGVGTKMFEFLEDVAKNAGCTCIHGSYNLKQPLESFYGKLGFTTTHHAVAKEI